MKALFKILLLIISFVAVIAPFTFLKPDAFKVSSQPKKSSETIKKTLPEKPLHSVVLPDFAKIRDVKTKKKTFFDFLKPTIIQANQNLLATRQQILLIEEKLGLEDVLSEQELSFLAQNIKKYRIKGELTTFQQVAELLNRVDIIPTELVLVQAANESAWGTSRFAKIGLNFFGLWCYKKGCGMVPKSRISGGKHEVAAFKSVEAAVKGYLYNINSHYAYSVFRSIRQQLREQGQPLSPDILATGLLPYSERGVDYVTEIMTMLRHNARYIQ